MRSINAVLIVILIFLLSGSQAAACGDKFLVVGRALRYDRAYPAKHPSSVLIYIEDQKVSHQLEGILKSSGHKVRSVSNEAGLFSTLQSAKFDVVLIPLSRAVELQNRIQIAPGEPAVLPVTLKMSKEDAKKEQCILNISGKNRHPVAVIDQVMEARIKGLPQICKTK
jgi:hypothetical protein